VSTVELHYGFTERPVVPVALETLLGLSPHDTTYFVGHESVVVTDAPGMVSWREHLYAVLYRNATSASHYFDLPPNRTFEIGMQVEL
jgi:KUP system potassium uptake protein